MEIRNLQKTGGSSFTIILPKDWIKSLNLSEKDQIEIFLQKKNQLALRPHVPNRILNVSLLIDNYSKDRIIREAIANYLAGITEITLRTNNYSIDLRNLARELSYKLIGFESFVIDSKNIKLKNSSSNHISARDYVLEMTKNIDLMYSDIILALKENNKQLAQDIIQRDVEIDKIELFLIREFNMLLYSLHPSDTSEIHLLEKHYYEHIAIRLERIADHIVRIANTLVLLKNGDKIYFEKREQENVKKVFNFYKECTKIIENLDKLRAHNLLSDMDKISKNAFINKEITKKPSVNILVEDSIERIRSYIINIAEETINYNAVKNLNS